MTDFSDGLVPDCGHPECAERMKQIKEVGEVFLSKCMNLGMDQDSMMHALYCLREFIEGDSMNLQGAKKPMGRVGNA